MEAKEIEILLVKYWGGKTTVDEENMLKVYFQKEAVPEHLNKEAALFRYYTAAGDLSLEDNFEEKLTEKIKERDKSLIRFPFIKIAAAFLLLLVSVYFIYQLNTRENASPTVADNNTITYEDPQVAYEETKKALLMVSGKLNTADKYTDEIKKINDASGLFK